MIRKIIAAVAAPIREFQTDRNRGPEPQRMESGSPVGQLDTHDRRIWTEPAAPQAAHSATESEIEWKPSQKVHLIFNLVLLIVGVGYLVLAMRLPQDTPAGPGPGFFPLLVATLFLACVGIDTARRLVHRARAPSVSQEVRFSWRVAVVLGTIVSYLLLVNITGHLIAAGAVAGLLTWLTGKRPWWQIALIAIGAGIGTDYLFSSLLGVRLPTGMTGLGVGTWM